MRYTKQVFIVILLFLLVSFITIATGRLDWPIQEYLAGMEDSVKVAVYAGSETPGNQTLHSYFSNDYQTARSRFIEVANSAGAVISRIPLSKLGPNNEELTIDIAWLGRPDP